MSEDFSVIIEGSNKRRLAMPFLEVDNASDQPYLPIKKMLRPIPSKTHNLTSHTDLMHFNSGLNHSTYMNVRMVQSGDHYIDNNHTNNNDDVTAIIYGGPDGHTKIILKISAIKNSQVYGVKSLPEKVSSYLPSPQCITHSIQELESYNYRNIEKLYHGRFSYILSAYHINSHQTVVVKILNKGDHVCSVRLTRSSKSCIERIANLNEDIIIKSLSHPNIIQIYDSVQLKSGKKALILEHCMNGSLTKLISKINVLTEVTALKYFKQMLSAVKYMHSKRYAVMNISCDHFLLNERNEVKMIDLSDVLPLGEMRTEVTAYTDYTSPEVRYAASAPYCTSSCDIFSLGICLHHMLTGNTKAMKSPTDLNIWKLEFDNKIPLSGESKELLSGMIKQMPNVRYDITRIECSDWIMSENLINQVAISGLHTLRAPRKDSLSAQDMWLRQFMDV